MKVVFLADNRKGDNKCEREHGLSMLIEVAGKKILFDAGASNLYLRNAEKLGIDLSQIDYIALSHGHFDHGDGLASFPRIANR
ncbi:MAG: MBL fold metallo-hydrolase [Endomicrobium sp.]|jgi:7,8-dihydropterin-6-yl-methyl-4-(beta-D-ribofuranosyl)aminobenzene 5'-phosphate synthase|nr:MBL fold metallo-hydrolase [Endomicrobium sp.]